jgi:hypothetical protein
MADIQGARKFIVQQVELLEKQLYSFDNVIVPRANADRIILKKLRDDVLKLDVLQKKRENKEEITANELVECVPASFR